MDYISDTYGTIEAVFICLKYNYSKTRKKKEIKNTSPVINASSEGRALAVRKVYLINSAKCASLHLLHISTSPETWAIVTLGLSWF